MVLLLVYAVIVALWWVVGMVADAWDGWLSSFLARQGYARANSSPPED